MFDSLMTAKKETFIQERDRSSYYLKMGAD
jgi:hypothetical protein